MFIGQNIDFALLTSELDGCLLSDAEMADSVESWSQLEDPFGSWHMEEVAA